MSDLQAIKDKLVNEDKIEDLLEAIGCEYIKPEQRGFLITAQLPERFYSTNKRSVQVKLDKHLSSSIRSKKFNGDIFNLVSYIHHDKRGAEVQKDLHKAKEFICRLFGWSNFLKKGVGDVVVKDYTASLKEIINGKKRKKEYKPNPVLPEEIMNEFYVKNRPLPYQGWIDEGISYRTQVLYGVGWDWDSKRIVFPLRNRFGQLVGVKGRIMKEEDDPERKYLYLYRCNNRYELFNFHMAHPYILIDKRVYIFEAEKSPMKAHSMGVFNTVAIGSSDITEEQADMIKQLGLDIEIVLCYDKDKTAKEVKEHAEIFKGRKVFGMFDVNGLLDEKDSPIDKGAEVWNKLVEENIYEINLK